jgi:muconolactone delta-isomerase
MKEILMEFLVEFEVKVPEGTPAEAVADQEQAEAVAAARLAVQGHVVRIWNRPNSTGQSTILGLYRAQDQDELNDLIDQLPMRDWMHVAVAPLAPHPNDPAAAASPGPLPGLKGQLPAPQLTLVYRLVATLDEPLDLGDTVQARRRIVALTGGTFEGPEISGRVVPGASADWQILLADGTALADLRYTLETDRGSLLFVRARGVRHGSPAVLARLARGEEVDASEYTFRLSATIETGDPTLQWLNTGVFVCVGGRQPGGVTYETYLVG